MPYVWEHRSWPRFRWDAAKLSESLGKARLCQGRLLSKVESLGLNLNLDAQAAILVEEALKTSAIEGEKLPEASVRSSVARHLGLPSAGLPPSERHVDGLVEILLDATQGFEAPLTEGRLKRWQAALFPTGFSGIHRIRVGAWRGPEPMRVVSGPLGRERIHFEAPPAKRLAREIRQFLSWWKVSRKTTEGLLRAGIAHLHFVTLHPFEDGNGRVARALTDMALAQDERLPQRFYSLSSQMLAERETYYDALERAQRGDGDITEWLAWFLACFEQAIRRSEGLIATILLKAEFWRRHAQTPTSERQRKIVNKMLDAGPSGFQGGLTTRKYVSMAKVSRATAYREISELVEKGILRVNEGGGRSVSYDINWPDNRKNSSHGDRSPP